VVTEGYVSLNWFRICKFPHAVDAWHLENIAICSSNIVYHIVINEVNFDTGISLRDQREYLVLYRPSFVILLWNIFSSRILIPKRWPRIPFLLFLLRMPFSVNRHDLLYSLVLACDADISLDSDCVHLG
jgi:hypothetical protein